MGIKSFVKKNPRLSKAVFNILYRDIAKKQYKQNKNTEKIKRIIKE